jgi:hypothetical protein
LILSLKIGFDLQEEYQIPILDHSMFLPCSEICICGHHISKHKGKGSDCRCTVERCTCRFGFRPDMSFTMTYKDFKEEVKPFLRYLQRLLDYSKEMEI